MRVTAACQRCGVAVSAGSRFCANCGADVSAEQGEAATRHLTAPPGMHDALLERVRHAALGEYEILTELGRGGMATVYLAHDIQLDRKVAIKVMLPSLLEGDDMIERFRLEARTAAQLSHPHIIPIYAVRTAEHLVYFVMKFVEGRPLDAIVRELGQLPVPMVQSIITKVGEALGYAHRHGIVHRDIKPANLMVDVEGMPVVTDFGIAKVADARALTMTGAMIGTPTYMSPEQCSAGAITGASDQYSLGVVAYQMLAGRVPFEADSIVGLLYQHCHEAPPALERARPDVPPRLRDAITRMLAKDPAQRFPTMEAAVEAIGSISLAFDDPVRTQLMGLARRGDNVSLLKRISTPRSPIPLRTKPSGELVMGGTRPMGGSSGALPANAGITGGALGGRRRAGAVAALATVVVIGGLAWLRPWAGSPATDAAVDRAPDAPAIAPPTEAGTADRPVAPITASDASPDAAATESPAPRVSQGSARVVATDIRIVGVPTSLTVGHTAPLRATVTDARGAAVPDRPVRWSSDDPALASITQDGLVTAVSPGTATVTVRADDLVRRATIPVVPVRAASVRVTPSAAALTPGASVRIEAQGLDEESRAIERAVSWRTADARIATVIDGVITATGVGSTVVTASIDGRDAAVAIRVAAPDAAAPDRPQAPAATDEADIRPAVEDVIRRYARALETKQLAEVRRVYPGMTTEQEAQFTQTLRTLDRLAVSLRVGALAVVGDEASAIVSGVYEFWSPENRRTERLPVQFTATLDRGPTGWQIRAIR